MQSKKRERREDEAAPARPGRELCASQQAGLGLLLRQEPERKQRWLPGVTFSLWGKTAWGGVWLPQENVAGPGV